MAKTQVQRNKALRKANIKKGLRLVQLWVPQYRVHELKQLVAKWREHHAEVNAESEWVGDSKKTIDKVTYDK